MRVEGTLWELFPDRDALPDVKCRVRTNNGSLVAIREMSSVVSRYIGRCAGGERCEHLNGESLLSSRAELSTRFGRVVISNPEKATVEW